MLLGSHGQWYAAMRASPPGYPPSCSLSSCTFCAKLFVPRCFAINSVPQPSCAHAHPRAGYLPSFWIKLRLMAVPAANSGTLAALIPPLLGGPTHLTVGLLAAFSAVACIIAADTGAYFCGKSFGRTQVGSSCCNMAATVAAPSCVGCTLAAGQCLGVIRGHCACMAAGVSSFVRLPFDTFALLEGTCQHVGCGSGHAAHYLFPAFAVVGAAHVCQPKEDSRRRHWRPAVQHCSGHWLLQGVLPPSACCCALFVRQLRTTAGARHRACLAQAHVGELPPWAQVAPTLLSCEHAAAAGAPVLPLGRCTHWASRHTPRGALGPGCWAHSPIRSAGASSLR